MTVSYEHTQAKLLQIKQQMIAQYSRKEKK